MVPIPRLKKRSDFLQVAACQRKVVMPTMIVQIAERSSSDKKGQPLPPVRVGFTASRKVGNAVARNRARRRLRAVIQAVAPSYSFAQEDLVLIARSATIVAPFNQLLQDFRQALTRLGFSPI